MATRTKTKNPISLQDLDFEAPRTNSMRVTLKDAAIATKSVAELGVTLRARLDGMLQVCTCNGTGEDGCVIDGPLVRADPSRGFASHRPVGRLGPVGQPGQLGPGGDDE